MATESSEPKSGIIIQIGILGIVGVLATYFALIPYFYRTIDELHHEKVAEASAEWHTVRDAELKRLADGKVPIEQAKAFYAAKGRQSLPAALQPVPSKDFGALEGWSNAGWKPLPRTLPASLVPDEPAPEVLDAGASDGAVAHTDAGHAHVPASAGATDAGTAHVPPHAAPAAPPGHR